MDVRRTNLRWLTSILLAATALPSSGRGLATCKDIGAVSTGIGWSGRGKFSNDDYGFTSKRGGSFVDGQVTLIVPTSEEKRARAIFDAFVHSLSFSRN
jgi:hypothetical protein